MPEGEAVPQESQPILPIPVSYEGESSFIKPLISVDGTRLRKTLVECEYPESTMVPLVIKRATGNETLPKNSMGFNAGESIGLDEAGIIEDLRNVRELIHNDLDHASSRKLRKFLEAARLLNPLIWPYIGLPYPRIFSGDSKRIEAYLQAAKNGFKGLTKQQSIQYAKTFFDQLLEYSAPKAVGWVLAHEYEHGRHENTKIRLTIGPPAAALFVGLLVDAVTKAPPTQSGASILGGAIVGGLVGFLAGRRIDEQASFEAGNKFAAQFAQAVTIDHDTFQQVVLGKSWVPEAPKDKVT